MSRNVAHIGAGRFSRTAHAPALQRLAAADAPCVRLAGVADLDPARPERAAALAADFRYARAFADWRRMIDETRADLVVCTVDPEKTFAVVRELIPRGVPMLVEKPQALSIDEAQHLTDLAARHRTVVYVAFNRRRMPLVELARAWTSQAGPLQRLSAEMVRTRPIDAGFCLKTAVHAFDTIRYLAGEVAEMRTCRTGSPTGIGDDYDMQLRLISGATVELSIRGQSGSQRERYTLHTNHARLEITLPAPYSDARSAAGARLFDGDRLRSTRNGPDDALVAIGVLPQYEGFLACLDAGRTPDCSLVDAEHSLRLAVAAEATYRGPVRDDTHA